MNPTAEQIRSRIGDDLSWFQGHMVRIVTEGQARDVPPGVMALLLGHALHGFLASFGRGDDKRTEELLERFQLGAHGALHVVAGKGETIQ